MTKMIELSDRIMKMEESATIAMSRKSRELKAEGKDVISLSLGEPDFNTPDFIKEAAVQAMNDNFTTYTPVPGYQDLREAISEKFKRDNGLDYPAESNCGINGSQTVHCKCCHELGEQRRRSDHPSAILGIVHGNCKGI